jgi:uncharacterized protein (DUF2267 family)
MKYHDFLGQVQHRARMATTEDAVSATRATLQTLAERITRGQANHVAAQLPEELAIYLSDAQAKPERFSLDEFLDRVASRENADMPDAVFHARVVVEVLGEAIAPDEMEQLRSQLPAEYKPLFESGSTGPMATG